MPKESSPNRKKAYDIFMQRKGKISNRDIAAQLGEDEKKISVWKQRDKWLDNLNVVQQTNGSEPECCTTMNEDKPKPKRGAPKGNKNAAGNPGGGAPQGNKNSYKHGLREKLLYGALSDEERELAIDLDFDEAIEIRKAIRDCDLKIIHFEKLKRDMQNKPAGVVIHSITKSETVPPDGQTKIGFKNMTTNHLSVTDYILRYEAEIHKYEKLKVKCLETLLKVNYDTNKLQLEIIRAQAAIKPEEQPEANNNGFVEALENTAKDAWSDG